ncbi:MAG: Asp-tRNA(Asn)/Glu-tRNA(Gln) amidotransferase subunit GatC [Gammaproteobacteria bacterium]|nr:Asp-tRNA(Asn)/Glu-tRNA(Gln) amidotransferase subunit GatC [Gammaproteobacteria bacterium]
MTIALETVQKTAYLARIALSEAELTRCHQEIEQIFTLIDQLQAVDTSGITPLAHAQANEQRTVADKVTEIDQHQKFQALAPATQLDYYLVPQVIE